MPAISGRPRSHCGALIRDLRVTGADTARVDYRSKGWVLHHNTDLWRATTPVDGAWGIWPMGGVWLANQMWDHYEFSGGREFLRREAYPAMKEAAQFALGILVEAPAGNAVCGTAGHKSFHFARKPICSEWQARYSDLRSDDGH